MEQRLLYVQRLDFRFADHVYLPSLWRSGYKEAIKDYIDFRDKTNLPMYMGEIGHNTDEWQAQFVKVMKEVNIGYTFWPYKKIDGSCMMGIQRPGSEMIRGFS